jgi:hypothetical protein
MLDGGDIKRMMFVDWKDERLNPACRACSHCDSGPASKPIRARSNFRARSQVTKSSGSLATLPSRMI